MTGERLLITGATGLLGSTFLRVLGRDAGRTTAAGHRTPFGRLLDGAWEHRMADLEAAGAGATLLRETAPDLVIHCAAWAEVGPCQADPVRAFRMDLGLPAELAEAARGRGARFVHLSTDQIFDGTRGGYREADPPSPLHVYGRAKADAERVVTALHPEALVLRLPLVYGPSHQGSRSASERLAAALREGRRLRLYEDEIRSPVLAEDVALAARALLDRGASGVVQVAGPRRVSRWEFGQAVARRFGLDPAPYERTRSPGPAGHPPRPRDLSMDISLLAAETGFVPRDPDEGLAACV